jgi:hypothetical protein
MDGSQPATVGELHPRPAVAPLDLRRSEPPRHPLILDGFFLASRPLIAEDTRCQKLCLHVLSSFQRTGLLASPVWPQYLRLGNLTRVFQTSQPCQHLFEFWCIPWKGISHLEGQPERGTDCRLRASRTLSATKKVPQISEQLFRPAGPGHARSTQYMCPAAACQPRAVHAVELRREPPVHR